MGRCHRAGSWPDVARGRDQLGGRAAGLRTARFSPGRPRGQGFFSCPSPRIRAGRALPPSIPRGLRPVATASPTRHAGRRRGYRGRGGAALVVHLSEDVAFRRPRLGIAPFHGASSSEARSAEARRPRHRAAPARARGPVARRRRGVWAACASSPSTFSASLEGSRRARADSGSRPSNMSFMCWPYRSHLRDATPARPSPAARHRRRAAHWPPYLHPCLSVHAPAPSPARLPRPRRPPAPAARCVAAGRGCRVALSSTPEFAAATGRPAFGHSGEAGLGPAWRPRLRREISGRTMRARSQRARGARPHHGHDVP